MKPGTESLWQPWRWLPDCPRHSPQLAQLARMNAAFRPIIFVCALLIAVGAGVAVAQYF
jgi:hypothetical protein